MADTMKMTPWMLLFLALASAANIQRDVPAPFKAVSETPAYSIDDVKETESAGDFVQKASETLPSAPDMFITGNPTKEEKCKFPEYIQGSFIDLHIDGGKFQYTVVEHENNTDVDNKVVENEKTKFVGINHENPTQQVKSNEDKIMKAGVSPFVLFTSNKGQRDGTKPMGLWNEIKSIFGFEDDSTVTSKSTPESTTQQPTTSTEITRKFKFIKRDTSAKSNQNKSEILFGFEDNSTLTLKNPFVQFTSSKGQRDDTKPMGLWDEIKSIFEDDSTVTSESIPESNTQQPMTSTEVIRKFKFIRRDTSAKLNQNKSEFLWNCTMPVEVVEHQEQGIKFLVWGGRVKYIKAGNANRGTENVSSVSLEEESKETMSYACLRVKTRVPDVMEYTIIGKGMPNKDQELKDFARELCSEHRKSTLDDHTSGIKNPIYVSKVSSPNVSLKDRENEESSSKSPVKRSVDFGPTRCTPRRTETPNP